MESLLDRSRGPISRLAGCMLCGRRHSLERQHWKSIDRRLCNIEF